MLDRWERFVGRELWRDNYNTFYQGLVWVIYIVGGWIISLIDRIMR